MALDATERYVHSFGVVVDCGGTVRGWRLLTRFTTRLLTFTPWAWERRKQQAGQVAT